MKKQKKKGAPKGNLNAVTQGAFIQLSRRTIDKRTRLGRWLRKIREEITSDIGGDPTRAQSLLIDRIVFKAANLNFIEMGLVSGNLQLADRYIQLANSFRMDLTALGLERKEKNYLDLKTYIQKKGGSGGRISE